MRAHVALRRSTPLAAVVCLAGLLSAQGAPQEQPPTFRAGVSLVRVDVSVFSGDGQPVTDLQASDFAITEDGVPQKVETVQFVRIDGQPVPGSPESLPIRSPEHARVEAAREDVRLFAIFLDDYHIDRLPAITLPLRKALERFVDELGPRDLVAVMDPLTPLTHLRFTRSRDELMARVQAFEGRRGEPFPVKSVLEEAQLSRPDWRHLRGGVSLSALTSLATYLGGLREGRKSVLFVSHGPPIGSGPADPNYARMEEAIEAANRGNVTINVFDARRLGSTVFGGPEVLRRLAQDTGGRSIVNTNDPERGLRQVVADASTYYLVGYAPSRDMADGKFHEIDVEVKRRGVRVTARQGYWAPRAEELTASPPAPNEPMLAEAMAPIVGPSDGRVADTWVGIASGPDGRVRLMVTWEPAQSRTGAATPTRVVVEPVAAGSGDALAPTQTIASAMTKGEEAEAMAAFTLDAEDMAVRLTALDESGETLDRWTEAIRLPSAEDGPIVLATPRVLRARSVFELRALNANPHPVPVAARVFRATDRVMIEIECANGAGAPPAIVAELLNNLGEPLLELSVPALVDGKARITLPLASLAPSVYAVRIRAGDGPQEAKHVVAFRVEGS